MNYKKLVVLLCLGSHLFMTTSLVNAKHKRNPFKAFSSGVRQIVKDPSQIENFKALEEEALKVLQQAKEDSNLYIKNADATLNAAWSVAKKNNTFRPTDFKNAADVLKQSKLSIPYLNARGLDLTSTMQEVRDTTRTELKSIRNMAQEEIDRERIKLRGVIMDLGHNDLLNWSDLEAWTEKMEARFSPKIDDVGTTLSQMIRTTRAGIQAEIAKSDSFIWNLAGIAGHRAMDIANNYITQLDAITSATTSATTSADYSINYDGTAELADEDDLFDIHCGHAAIPIRFGGARIFLPADRKVPAHCGGIAGKTGGMAFIKASEVPNLLAQSESIEDSSKPDDDSTKLNDLARAQEAVYKLPFGVMHDSRLLLKLLIEGQNIGITPHLRIPLAWTAPEPSPNTVSVSGGNTVVNNGRNGKFFFSPEFELAWFISPPSSGALATAVANVEFPIVARTRAVGNNDVTGAVLQQIILRVGVDLGVRWDKADIKITELVLSSLLRLMELEDGTEAAVAVVRGLYSLVSLAVAGATTYPTIVNALPGAAGTDRETIVALAATVPFLMAGLKMITEITFGDEATITKSVNNISLLKLQVSFGFLNAHYAAALAKKSLPLANVGFKLVRPGIADWTTVSLAILPQVTQVLYKLGGDLATNALFLQLWGPYSVITPQLAMPHTVAGSYFINNGSDQYEPLGVR